LKTRMQLNPVAVKERSVVKQKKILDDGASAT